MLSIYIYSLFSLFILPCYSTRLVLIVKHFFRWKPMEATWIHEEFKGDLAAGWRWLAQRDVLPVARCTSGRSRGWRRSMSNSTKLPSSQEYNEGSWILSWKALSYGSIGEWTYCKNKKKKQKMRLSTWKQGKIISKRHPTYPTTIYQEIQPQSSISRRQLFFQVACGKRRPSVFGCLGLSDEIRLTFRRVRSWASIKLCPFQALLKVSDDFFWGQLFPNIFSWISWFSLHDFVGFSFMVSGVFPSTSLTTCPPCLVRSSGWHHGPRASRFGSQRLGPGSAPRWPPRGQPSRSGTIRAHWEGHWENGRRFNGWVGWTLKTATFSHGFCGRWRGFFPSKAWIIVHWWEEGDRKGHRI